jgi:hypothetical protein
LQGREGKKGNCFKGRKEQDRTTRKEMRMEEKNKTNLNEINIIN